MAAIILCADDYGLTRGVSEAIGKLARARRLSATSALVTTEAWPQAAAALAEARDSIALGLHLNLTLGQPLTRMARLAPDGALPSIGNLTGKALRGALDVAELEGEISAQIQRFKDDTGRLPDLIDGHQHAHALPLVRQATIRAIAAGGWPRPPLVRVPSDAPATILRRGREAAKALAIAALAGGFKGALRRAGLPFNDSFAGISSFSRANAYDAELAAAMRHPGQCHIVMCHPGWPDDALRRLDPVVERRADEFAALIADTTLPERIWRPGRPTDDGTIDWTTLAKLRS